MKTIIGITILVLITFTIIPAVLAGNFSQSYKADGEDHSSEVYLERGGEHTFSIEGLPLGGSFHFIGYINSGNGYSEFWKASTRFWGTDPKTNSVFTNPSDVIKLVVYSMDLLGNIHWNDVKSVYYWYIYQKEIVDPIQQLEGRNQGMVGENLIFTLKPYQSNLGHNLEYQFDWGDGNQSIWSTSTSFGHTYNSAGSFKLRVRARCITHISVISSWSSLTVTINNPKVSITNAGIKPGSWVDNDGDGYASALTIFWDSKIDFGKMSVYGNIHADDILSFERDLGNTSSYLINTDNTRMEFVVPVVLKKLSKTTWDFQIDLYKTGTSDRVARLAMGNHPNLNDVKIELPEQDVVINSAKILPDFSISPQGTQTIGTEILATVTIENTGNTERNFWVGISFKWSNSGEWPESPGWLDIKPEQTDRKIKPTEKYTLYFKFSIPDHLPEGNYDAIAAVWDNYEPENVMYIRPSDQKEFTVLGQMKGRFDEKTLSGNDSFIVSSTGVEEDPYNIGSFDPGGLFKRIPIKYRGGTSGKYLADLPENLNTPLQKKNSGGGSLTNRDDKIVVLFHGWRGSYSSSDWDELIKNLIGTLPYDWVLVTYDWRRDADTGLFIPNYNAIENRVKGQNIDNIYPSPEPVPGIGITIAAFLAYTNIKAMAENRAIVAAYRAYMHGLVLARKIEDQVGPGNLNAIQIIAHSAGSWGAYSALRYLREKYKNAQIQITYLDPFIPDQTYYKFLPGEQAREFFDDTVLASTINFTSVRTQGACQSDANWSEWDITDAEGIVADIVDIPDLVNILKLIFPWLPDYNVTTMARKIALTLADLLSEPTIIHENNWNWNISKNALILRMEDLQKIRYSGHPGPIRFYADSVSKFDDPLFKNRGWNISLPKNLKASNSRIIRLEGNLEFGNTEISKNKTGILRIYNDGNEDLQIFSIAFPSGFAGQWSGIIPAESFRDIQVFFTPGSEKAYYGNIIISSNKTEGPNQIYCSGTGILLLQPDLIVTPQGHEVPYLNGTVTFTVNNIGTGSMNWIASVLSGGSWISIESNPEGINSGEFLVAFSTNEGNDYRSAKVRITSPGSIGSPCDVSIIQEPMPIIDQPILSVNPPVQQVESSAGSSTFTIINAGTGTMEWNAAVTSGESWLSITSNDSGINNGTISVAFTNNPETNSRTGTILITAPGAENSPIEVRVVQFFENFHCADNGSGSDQPNDGIIGDWELLHAIDVWMAGDLMCEGPFGDFDLLHLIDLWAQP